MRIKALQAKHFGLQNEKFPFFTATKMTEAPLRLDKLKWSQVVLQSLESSK